LKNILLFFLPCLNYHCPVIFRSINISKLDKFRSDYDSVYSPHKFKDHDLKSRKSPRDYRNQKPRFARTQEKISKSPVRHQPGPCVFVKLTTSGTMRLGECSSHDSESHSEETQAGWALRCAPAKILRAGKRGTSPTPGCIIAYVCQPAQAQAYGLLWHSLHTMTILKP